ncbi:hypothetical protein H4R19_005683 [Coemansia spiralis]|nr:hypothetical protein H4R19_005683 [Coemansia spiralis]
MSLLRKSRSSKRGKKSASGRPRRSRRSAGDESGDPSMSAFQHAREFAMTGAAKHRADAAESKAARQARAARLLQKRVDMYKRKYGSDFHALAEVPESSQPQPQQRRSSKRSRGRGHRRPSDELLLSDVSEVDEDGSAARWPSRSMSPSADAAMATAADKGKQIESGANLAGSDDNPDKGTQSLAAANKQTSGSAFRTAAVVYTDRDDNRDSQRRSGSRGWDRPAAGRRDSHKSRASASPSAGKPHRHRPSPQQQQEQQHQSKHRRTRSATRRLPFDMSQPDDHSPPRRRHSGHRRHESDRHQTSARHSKSQSKRSSVSRWHEAEMLRGYSEVPASHADAYHAAEYGMTEQAFDIQNYLDMPRHSIIDPSMLSFDVPGTAAQHASYGGSSSAEPQPSDSLAAPSEGPVGLSVHRAGGSSGWSVAKPASASLAAPPVLAPAEAGSGSKSVSPFAPVSVAGASGQRPIQSFRHLRTTADVAAAMDAAAAGDKDALRAIQATTMQSDIDDMPTEPADPRVEFSSHRPVSHSAPPPPPVADTAPPRASPTASTPRVSPRASVVLSPSAAAAASAAPSNPQPKLSRNVRDRLLRAKMKQLEKHKDSPQDEPPA